MASIQCIIWTFSDLFVQVCGWTSGVDMDRFSEQYFQWGQLALVTCQQTLLCWRVSAVCIFVASDIKSVWSPSALATLVTVSGGRWWSNAAPYPHSYQSHTTQLTHPACSRQTCHGRNSIHFQFSAKAFCVLLIFVRLFSVFSFYSCLSVRLI